MQYVDIVLQAVAYGRVVGYRKAQLDKSLANPLRVSIQPLTGNQLIADSYNFCTHSISANFLQPQFSVETKHSPHFEIDTPQCMAGPR